jgi:hypothetical protein
MPVARRQRNAAIGRAAAHPLPDPNLVLAKMPDVPEGYEISRIDMVVRLRKTR